MTIDRFVNLLAAVTLFEMMVTIGLGVALAEIVGVAREWRTMTRAALANYVVVPAAAVALLLMFRAPFLTYFVWRRHEHGGNRDVEATHSKKRNPQVEVLLFLGCGSRRPL